MEIETPLPKVGINPQESIDVVRLHADLALTRRENAALHSALSNIYNECIRLEANVDDNFGNGCGLDGSLIDAAGKALNQTCVAVQELIAKADRCDAAERFKARVINALGITTEDIHSIEVVKAISSLRKEVEIWSGRASQYVSDEQTYGTHRELAAKVALLTVELSKHHDKAHLKEPEIEHCDVCKVLDCPPL